MNTLKYNVSRITVQRALSELKLQGVITRKPRAGTFVLSPAPKPVFSPEKSSDRINIGVVAPFDMESPGIYQYLDGILSALSVCTVRLLRWKTIAALWSSRCAHGFTAA